MQNEKPKYIQISDKIIKSIEDMDLQPGDKIMSENELIKKYKVSNTTARKSLLEVELKGWATRIKGKGTFVINRTQDKHLTRTLGSIYTTRTGFDENLIKEGFTPNNIILEKTILDAGISTEINGRHYKIDGSVVKVHRLRYADDILLKDEIRYISLSVCPKINMVDPGKSYFNLYEEKYGLQLTDIKQSLSATIFKPEGAENYFEANVPIPVFILDSAIFCSDNRIVEIEKSFYRGDKYKFSIISKPQLDSISKNER